MCKIKAFKGVYAEKIRKTYRKNLENLPKNFGKLAEKFWMICYFTYRKILENLQSFFGKLAEKFWTTCRILLTSNRTCRKILDFM